MIIRTYIRRYNCLPLQQAVEEESQRTIFRVAFKAELKFVPPVDYYKSRARGLLFRQIVY